MSDQLADAFVADTNGRRVRGAQCPLINFWGAVGGAGASTLAVTAAEIAATAGKMQRVILVDGDLDRGSLRLMLRIDSGRAPSLIDAAVADNPQNTVIAPSRIGALRSNSSRLDEVAFGVVLAPTYDQAEAQQATRDTVFRLIEMLRLHADLVIADLGSMEFRSSAGTAAGLMHRLSDTGAWNVAVTTDTFVGIQQMIYLASQNADKGFSRDKLLAVVNKRSTNMNEQRWEHVSKDESVARWTHPVDFDPTRIEKVCFGGGIPYSHPQLAPVLSRILYSATGYETLEASASAPIEPSRFAGRQQTEQATKPRKAWLARVAK